MRFEPRWLLPLLFVSLSAWAQQAAPAPAPPRSCSVMHYQPTDADLAYAHHKYSDAETMYRAGLAKSATDPAAMTGLTRTLLAEEKGPDALAMVQGLEKAYPENSTVLGLLGEVHLRLGDMDDVISYLNRALKLDTCNAWAHYQASRYLYLTGMFARAKTQINAAHLLAPDEPAILNAWKDSNPPTMTSEERIALLKEQLAQPNLSAEEHDAITASLNAIKTKERGDCQAVTPIAGTTENLWIMSHRDGPYGTSLQLQINGKKRYFQVDTGASGLTLSRSSAQAAGLTPEMATKIGGVGDQGPTQSYVTHVDDIKIGAIEFKNCMVTVVEKNNALDVDGLIGTDVFKNYLVTLDFPGQKLRLDSLPSRAGEAEQAASLNTTGEDQGSASTPVAPQDRYIAPEMKGWAEFYRIGHLLIVPTTIGDAPTKLFVLDSGSSLNLISPEAARLVSRVSSTDEMRIKGISGEVKNVLMANNNVTITFAGVRQSLDSMISIDTSTISRDSNLEISGFVGFRTLRELVVTLDYRDNLMHVVYDPKHGIHY